jgi:hypothetical protein
VPGRLPKASTPMPEPVIVIAGGLNRGPTTIGNTNSNAPSRYGRQW